MVRMGTHLCHVGRSRGGGPLRERERHAAVGQPRRPVVGQLQDETLQPLVTVRIRLQHQKSMPFASTAVPTAHAPHAEAW